MEIEAEGELKNERLEEIKEMEERMTKECLWGKKRKMSVGMKDEGMKDGWRREG